MNANISIKESIENKISFYHLVIFMFSLPFDRFYSTLVLISFLIHTIIFLRPGYPKLPPPTVFILQSVFYVTILSSFYSVSVNNSLDVIGRQLAIFVFPLLLFYSTLDLRKYRLLLMRAVMISGTATILYLYFDAIHVIRFNGISFHALFSWQFVNQNFSLPIHMHATYLSMLIVPGLIFCVQQIIKSEQAGRIIYAATGLVLLTGLIQLSSKSAIFAFLLIMLTGVPWLLIRKKSRWIYFLGAAVFLTLSISFILSLQAFRDRYVVTLKDDLYENGTVADISSRVDRWKVAMFLIRQSPVFGTGSGSEIPLLRESYFKRKMYGSYLDSLNVHNQYLSFLINSGIVGLLVYLATLVWGFCMAIKNRDIYLFSLMILVSVISLAEDLLDVNKGIFVYSFFFSFLVLSLPKSCPTRFDADATRDV